jgi:hypothetical protein
VVKVGEAGLERLKIGAFPMVVTLASALDVQPRRPRGRPRSEPGSPTHRRPCEQIGYPDAIEMIHALHYARHIGQEPTVHVTVQWRHAPNPTPTPERLTRLVNLIGVWVRRRTGRPAVWVYSREIGLRKGEHLHMLLHLPDRLVEPLRRNVQHWLELEADDVKPSASRVDLIRPGDLRHLQSYLLKESAPAFLETQNVSQHHIAKATGGIVAGKRTRISKPIGKTARRKARAEGFETWTNSDL